MATSGSWDFSITRNDLINSSLRAARILGRDETADSDQITFGSQALNMLVKQLQGPIDQAFGRKAWSRQRLTLFLAKGQHRYTIGPASTDARCTAQYGRTTLSAAEAAGQTTLSITSNTDTTTYPGTTVTMTAGDIVGVQLDDGTIQWTTISGTPSTTMDVAVALTGAAASGNYVFWFTSRAQRPVLIEAASLRNADRKDTPLVVYTEVEDYTSFPDKFADGSSPTSMLVEYQRINTAVTFDVQPTDVTKVIEISALYPMEDYDSASDDVAFPQEAYRALKFMLAGDLWAEYKEGDPPSWLALKIKEAKFFFDNLNPETSTLFFEPGRE